MHPRNRHTGRYDFEALERSSPHLTTFLRLNIHGDRSLDFADPEAVKALNQALLANWYGVKDWDIPEGYLCPPLPGRADYVHALADLLGELHAGDAPRGPSVRVLDVGVGANAIYPLIGHFEYGWKFVGSDIDGEALDSAERIRELNPAFASALDLRFQEDSSSLFRGVIGANEVFDLTICNPPFFASEHEARAASRRKWDNLGKAPVLASSAPVKNFGGRASELWCEGGELEFIRAMIAESAEFGAQCFWFSSLVSKSEHVGPLRAALERAGATSVRVIEMTQGQKISRALAWTFLTAHERSEWARTAWA